MIIKSSGGGDNKKELIKESDKYLSIDGTRKWQGLNTKEELGKILTNSKDTNIYKLFFKSEVIQNEGEENNGKGIKGAITLAKISSKGEGESQIQLEEISKEESEKIWLIIAKGEETNSIYLMPSVFCNSGGNNEKKIWTEGVKSIDDWTGNSQLEDKTLKKSLKEGFAVVRGGRNL